MDLNVWLIFTAACIVFSFAPGAGAITSINNSLNGGVKTAVKGIIGLQAALATHILIVSLGLGALLASSAFFFEAIKYIGAIYLLYLGIKKFFQPWEFNETAENRETGYGQLIKQGFLVNLTNPKSIVFLSAFLPQFLNSKTPLPEQYLILGGTVLIIDFLVMLSYSFLAALVRPYLSSDLIMGKVNKVFGSLFIMLGLMLAKAER